jgi:16S rRNA (adenine1518-N6/adenine1519-N6)-dimethyltransferase
MTVHKKRYGQHFLQNIGAAHRIIDLLEVAPGDRVLEIGAGGGVLTGILAKLPVNLIAVEIDSALASKLSESLGTARNVTVRNEDILEFEFAELGCEREWKVVGNLPYNVTSPILAKVFDNSRAFSAGVFMVQREVANRLTADVGSSDYSSLTVFARTYCDVARAFVLKPGSFFPPPKVSSAVVTLRFGPPALTDRDSRLGFHRFVQAVFAHRRKTILNCLMLISKFERKTVSALLEDIGIESSKRPQHVSLQQFISIYAAMSEVMDA